MAVEIASRTKAMIRFAGGPDVPDGDLLPFPDPNVAVLPPNPVPAGTVGQNEGLSSVLKVAAGTYRLGLTFPLYGGQELFGVQIVGDDGAGASVYLVEWGTDGSSKQVTVKDENGDPTDDFTLDVKINAFPLA